MTGFRSRGLIASLLFIGACAIPVADAPQETAAEASAAQVEIIRQQRPPLHTRAYSEALEGALGFEPDDVAKFEGSVAANPQDWASRAKILAFANRADQAGLPENLARRKTHVFWLIEHDPGSEILSSYLGKFQPGELSDDEWMLAAGLWDAAAQANPGNDRVFANAAHFFAEVDPGRRRRYLEIAAETAPTNARHGAPLGDIYARAIIDSTRRATPEMLRLAAEAERILETTNNAATAETASYIFNSERNHPFRQKIGPAPRIDRLAKRMIVRARLLNPDADESWINPAPPPPIDSRLQNPPTEQELAAARARVVRLSPSDFPELPAGLAAFLTERRCTIPQISQSRERMNLIRGEFFRAGEPGWGVICSKDGRSEILVFPSDEDREPVVLVEFADPVCLLEEWNCGTYQTAITTADRDFILYHYRAYGGTEPPPIDHHGIDVAAVEKASAVRYFHNGEWLTLTGAD